MESEECIPAAAAVPPPPPPLLAQQQQQQNSGRNRKRGGIVGSMSSSVETQVGSYSPHNTHHHDKVLRSHTRRGRGAGPATVSLSTPSLSGGISSRRRQRSSGCSSPTDEDDSGGVGGGSKGGIEGTGDTGEYEEVSISLINCGDHPQDPEKIEEDTDDVVASGSDNNSSGSIIITSNNNINKGIRRKAGGGGGVGEHDAVIIPSSSSCFSPTNGTKELCEQAGLLGGTIKTTTIHSGGTRLSSSCIPPHNDGATQQCCNSNNAGEHSSSNSKGNDNNATINCSQKIAAAAQQRIMDNNVASRFRRRSHRQHGHQHDHHQHRGEKSTPPAAAVVVTAADKDGHDEDDDEPHHHYSHDNNNAGRARRESSQDNDDEEMCQEDPVSCELPGKPNAVQSESSPASSLSQSLSLLESPSSLLVVGALSSSVTITATNPAGAAVTTSLVKSERGSAVSTSIVCVGENGGKEKEEKNAVKKRVPATKELFSSKQGDESIHFASSVISVIKQEPGQISGDTGREHSVPTTGETGGASKVTKIGGHDDGRWSAGEDARQTKGKDGAKGEWTGLSLSVSSLPSSSSVVCSGAATSMPQKAGVKGSSIQQEDGGSIFVAPRNEQSRTNKVSGATTPAGGTVTTRAKRGTSSKKNPVAITPVSGFSNSGNHTFSTQCGGKSAGASSGGGGGKPASVPAPMLLMNNLPYMGELTFDTRPRRGRKPKKADICHLISKNYGIHFPAGVTQASLQASIPISNSKSAAGSKGAATGSVSLSSKKTTTETISVTSKHNVASASRAGLVPPTFCNRDVSIVPIIPTTWGGSGGGGRNATTPLSFPVTSDGSKCSSSTAANLLKPLSSLAQQLMLQHHHQNSSSHCSATSSSSTTTRGMTNIASSAQQTISMFPLPAPSSFSQSHHSAAADVSRANSSKRSKSGVRREPEYITAGEDEEENMMEVDNESFGGVEEEDDEDNQDSPLNLCMRDKSMMVLGHPRYHEPLSLVKEEALDVRWCRSGAGGGVGGAIKGLVRSSRSAASGNNTGSSYCSDGAKEMGSGGNSGNKRGMMQTSIANSAMKSGKSAKLMGSSSGSSTGASLNFSLVNSSNSSNNICDSDSVSNLVSCRPSPSPSSSPLFGNVQQPSKLSPNIFAISAHHLQNQGLENTGKGSAGGKSKQGGQSRKKRELNLRGDVSISTSGSPGSQSVSGGTPSGPATLSSFGGTLFGQSTAGINDGAEVSICKFKFTGGAKPCLQEKKMLSVDSGGNFRFYSDKTTGTSGAAATTSTGKLSGKGQHQLPMSSSAGSANTFYSTTTGRVDLSQSPPSAGDGVECHYALSSLPKSAKSMSMCMPVGTVNNTGIQVQMGSTAAASMGSSKCNSISAKLSLPLMPQSSSTSSGGAAGNPYAALSISPTTEELQQLHLSMQDQVQQQSRSSSRVSPYPSGDYSYSSSNSCSSSDNGYGGDPSSSTKSTRQTTSVGGGGNSHHARSGSGTSSKMKLKRKRRTRKSLMREKLEKTFKEKGFLIQTQQLESAEGATYCKFRQLRKFTRYLFRSWKDYLPDHVKDISDNNANNNNNNNGSAPGSEQALPNSDHASNLTGQKEADSNVQSMADEDGDMDDDEDDGDEEEEDAESEVQPRQSLISQEESLTNHNEDDSEDDDEEEDEDNPRSGKMFKSSHRRQRTCTTTATARSSATPTPPSKSNTNLRDDSESNKDDDNEDIELQVDA